MSATHYEILGVASEASFDEIRLAYLRKARENHPDRAPASDPLRRGESERAMVAVNAAWFVLKDQGRRRVYDQQLEAARRPWEEPEPDDEWLPETEHPFDMRKESPFPTPEYGTHGHPAASIARLYTLVMLAVFILLSIAFAYAVVRSGSVGMVELPQ
ncbi:MAG TPA: J domain-containing protein [Actinomycetota bacterium]|nr:J domain-containing protein [Actinomycetota bacterium]